MKREIIHLTEGDLHELVKSAVKKILKEEDEYEQINIADFSEDDVEEIKDRIDYIDNFIRGLMNLYGKDNVNRMLDQIEAKFGYSELENRLYNDFYRSLKNAQVELDDDEAEGDGYIVYRITTDGVIGQYTIEDLVIDLNTMWIDNDAPIGVDYVSKEIVTSDCFYIRDDDRKSIVDFVLRKAPYKGMNRGNNDYEGEYTDYEEIN